MTIAIYADPLSVFTSFMPQRGLITLLIRRRPEDKFVFYIHGRFLNHHVIVEFFKQLSMFSNWHIVKIWYPHKLTRIFQFLGFPFPLLPSNADIYISPDVETFGKHSKPVINFVADMTVFDDLENTSLSLFNSKFRRKSIRKMNGKSDAIVVVSKYTRTRYLHYFPKSIDKVQMIYNGINQKWFDNNVVTNSTSEVPFWIWMGGSYNSRKNLNRLFLAYKKLKSSSLSTVPKILLVGLDDDSKIRLFKILREYGLSDNVQIISKVPLDELINLVDKSKGLLFPSIYEGFGLPVIEVYSRGKNVLVSNITSLPEVSNNLGILCDPLSIESIYEGLLMMCGNQEDSEKRNLRISWAKQFSYENALISLNNIITTITT